MIGYIKLKTDNKELYKSDYLEKLKNKNTIFSKLKYNVFYFFYKFIVFIKYLGNIITIKKLYYSYIFILPFNNKKASKYRIKKVIKKLQKLIKKYKVTSLIFSNELKKINNIKKYNINFENKNTLMPYLIKEILIYILTIQQTKTELENLYICIKEINQINIENIYYLSNYFKTINIITPNIKKFQMIVSKLEENGILVTLSNNKEKSLKKSNIIVNFDFTTEELGKYIIYRNAIMISLNENETYKNLGFEGVEIKNVQIDISNELKSTFKENFLLENYSLCDLYKCILNENESFQNIKLKMEENKILVTKLYGKNGEISCNEFLKLTI